MSLWAEGRRSGRWERKNTRTARGSSARARHRGGAVLRPRAPNVSTLDRRRRIGAIGTVRTSPRRRGTWNRRGLEDIRAPQNPSLDLAGAPEAGDKARGERVGLPEQRLRGLLRMVVRRDARAEAQRFVRARSRGVERRARRGKGQHGLAGLDVLRGDQPPRCAGRGRAHRDFGAQAKAVRGGPRDERGSRFVDVGGGIRTGGGGGEAAAKRK